MTATEPEAKPQRYSRHLLPHDAWRSATADGCNDCGSWVWSQPIHNRWHERADLPTITMEDYESNTIGTVAVTPTDPDGSSTSTPA